MGVEFLKIKEVDEAKEIMMKQKKSLMKSLMNTILHNLKSLI